MKKWIKNKILINKTQKSWKKQKKRLIACKIYNHIATRLFVCSTLERKKKTKNKSN